MDAHPRHAGGLVFGTDAGRSFMSLFFWQWRAEMRKLVARKRTYLGFGAFVLLEIVLYVVLHLDKVESWFRHMIQHQGEVFERYFSALTLGYLVLRLAVF